MVLQGERCTEQRHDAVAHDLIYSTLISMHCFHHALEYRIEELAGFFRVSIREQLHRAFEVGEQHRYSLTLAFQGGLAGEYLVGEVLGSELLRGCEAQRWRNDQRRAALAAEFLLGRIASTARRAGGG